MFIPTPTLDTVIFALVTVLLMMIAYNSIRDARRIVQAVSVSFNFIGLLASAHFIETWWASQRGTWQEVMRFFQVIASTEVASIFSGIIASRTFIVLLCIVLILLALYKVASWFLGGIRQAKRAYSVNSRRSSSKTIVKP